LVLKATVTGTSEQIESYTWTVTGDGAELYPPPTAGPNVDTWDVGSVHPKHGTLTFKCVVAFEDDDECEAEDDQEIEVGIRKDDVIVIGWINPAGVALNASTPDARVLALFPDSGPPVPDDIKAAMVLDQILEGDTSPICQSLSGGPDAIVPLDTPSRLYLLKWLFKFGGNSDPSTVIPGGTFRNANDPWIDNQEVLAFASVPTNFKLFNRLQIRYTLTNGAPTIGVLRRESRIGTTKSPIFLGTEFPGQYGPNNYRGGKFGSGAPSDPFRYVNINDGSPDMSGVEVLNVLMGNNLPASGLLPARFWENIGDQIHFELDDSPTPTIRTQPYPTYYIYLNGSFFDARPQASSPTGNFVDSPYPFGRVICPHPGQVDTPQGRCGDAGLSADPTAHVPPSQYTIP